MKSTIFFLVFLAFSEAGALEASKECPPPELIAPYCSCKEFGDEALAMMHCQNMTSPEDLFFTVDASKAYDIMAITIANSTINYIPEHTFKGTKFTKIRFSHSRILTLSDTTVAFKGLENHLQEISATGEDFIAFWDWNQLKNLRRLDSIDIHDIKKISIRQKFPALPSLAALGISRARLSFVPQQVFQNLQNLKLLVLKENEISALSRSMLPKPALKLYHIDLSENKLASLPHDFFTEMPNLKEVILLNNMFTTLEEETFSGIFNTLQLIHLNGNKLNCDCRLRWLVKHDTPHHFDGKCHAPQKLHNRMLQHLKNDDLVCE